MPLPWITLAAISDATERVRGGPQSPLARRRPAKVARETVTLDRLSGGRLVLGVGMGNDHSGNELSGTGEEPDDRRRVAGPPCVHYRQSLDDQLPTAARVAGEYGV